MKIGLLLGAIVVIVLSCNYEDKKQSSFEQIQNQILTTSCAISGCHQSTSDPSFLQHGLVLERSVAYQNLIDQNPKNANAIKDNLLLVKPFKAEESLLYHKLNFASHHQNDYGNKMPLGLPPLYVGQVEFIRRWIEAGAPKDGNPVDETLLQDKTVPEEKFDPLQPPATGKGMQVTIPEFEVAPNFERELFLYKKIGNTQDIYVNRIEVKMRPNSHHFVLYDFGSQTPSVIIPPLDVVRDIRNPNGSNNLLNMLPMAYHTYVTGTQTAYSDYRFPDNVVLVVPAGAALDMNTHYVNKGASPIKGEVFMNLYTTDFTASTKVARPINFGNQNFSLPANQRTVITRDFQFNKAVKIISLTSHTHQLGEKFVIKIKGGPRNGETIYTSADWHHPEVINYSAPILLSSGEGLTSEITYNNVKSKSVGFGLTSEDEMGIIFGYYIDN
jgi:Copper type II ascorbate-dependent monooxygenase, C-terminal domain